MSLTLLQHIDVFTSVLVKPAQETDCFVQTIELSSKISPQLAIKIYQNNVNGSKINALKVIYPACEKILGSDAFCAIAKAYVSADVSGSSDLNRYGATFSQHLNSIIETGRLPAEYSYLPDLTSLEFLVHAAYYAEDDAVFDFNLFADRMKSQKPLYFQLSKSLALFCFKFPIHQIWLRNNNESSSESKNIQAGIHDSIQALTESQYLLVYREKNTPVVIQVSQCVYQLLHNFIGQQSLQKTIESCQLNVNEQCNVDELLPGLIANGWITGVL